MPCSSASCTTPRTTVAPPTPAPTVRTRNEAASTPNQASANATAATSLASTQGRPRRSSRRLGQRHPGPAQERRSDHQPATAHDPAHPHPDADDVVEGQAADEICDQVDHLVGTASGDAGGHVIEDMGAQVGAHHPHVDVRDRHPEHAVGREDGVHDVLGSSRCWPALAAT